MKKRMAIALAAILTISLITLSGCGAGGAADVAPTEPAVTQDDAAADEATTEQAGETSDDAGSDAETEEISADTEDADTSLDETTGDEGGNVSDLKLSDGITIPADRDKPFRFKLMYGSPAVPVRQTEVRVPADRKAAQQYRAARLRLLGGAVHEHAYTVVLTLRFDGESERGGRILVSVRDKIHLDARCA